MNTLDIVIVNWNAGQQLKDCCDSIVMASASVNLGKVVIVDNASSDDALSLVSGNTLPLEIIRNDRNRGFAAACNQGAAAGTSEYILFLNPDTRLEPESLSRPVGFLSSPEAQKYAVCGVQLVEANGLIQRTCARFPTPAMLFRNGLGLDKMLPRIFPSHFMTEWEHHHSADVDHVIGAFYLIRRGVFETMRGFDERFFVYLEDLDLSRRAARAGWKCRYCSEARAYHKGGGTSESVMARRLFYSVRSRILYGYKHFGRTTGSLLLLAAISIELPVRMLYGLTKGDLQRVVASLAAYAMVFADIPAMVRTGFAP
jgi:N-acetylglucosaminyl-diphospho-decaprenol L-rhamnosyltransferase